MNGISHYSTIVETHFDDIYSFVEPKTRKSLALCSRKFYQLHLENDKYLRLVNFIIQNYTVVATNLGRLTIWRVLKISSAFLIGENHLDQKHRMLFAEFVHQVWEKDRWAIFTEGGKCSLGTGQIAYVREEIARTHETWEALEKYDTFFNYVYLLYYHNIELISIFLILRDEADDAKKSDLLNTFINQINFFLGKNMLPDFRQVNILENLEKLKLLNLYKRLISYSNKQDFKRFKALASFYSASMLIDLRKQCFFEISEIIDFTLSPRDEAMVDHILEKIQTGKRVVVIAGANHVTLREKSPVKELLKKMLLFYPYCQEKQHLISCLLRMEKKYAEKE